MDYDLPPDDQVFYEECILQAVRSESDFDIAVADEVKPFIKEIRTWADVERLARKLERFGCRTELEEAEEPNLETIFMTKDLYLRVWKSIEKSLETMASEYKKKRARARRSQQLMNNLLAGTLRLQALELEIDKDPGPELPYITKKMKALKVNLGTLYVIETLTPELPDQVFLKERVLRGVTSPAAFEKLVYLDKVVLKHLRLEPFIAGRYQGVFFHGSIERANKIAEAAGWNVTFEKGTRLCTIKEE